MSGDENYDDYNCKNSNNNNRIKDDYAENHKKIAKTTKNKTTKTTIKTTKKMTEKKTKFLNNYIDFFIIFTESASLG